VAEVTEPVADVVEPVTKPVAEVVQRVTKPVVEVVDPVTDPVIEVLQPTRPDDGTAGAGTPVHAAATSVPEAEPAPRGPGGRESVAGTDPISTGICGSTGTEGCEESSRAVASNHRASLAAGDHHPSLRGTSDALPGSHGVPVQAPSSPSPYGQPAQAAGNLDLREYCGESSVTRFAAGDDTVPHSRAALVRVWPG